MAIAGKDFLKLTGKQCGVKLPLCSLTEITELKPIGVDGKNNKE